MAKTRTRGRACTGKQRHKTQEQAVAHRERLIRKRGAWAPSLVIYECPAGCGGWHVGHREGMRSDGRRG